ncbi:MAG: hypothetical protein HN353_12375 [Bdellovibrionales bacterium]|jgi:hypothetical protein|nr:hypothetical protein [Bdellovibrionales bacterium]MBT3526311.1 hypothetical protein [Bdellovibrionales bacterium]MBT7669190.1 hypothetical protein [Bdellovibrionales bacterium]MBT7768332.1 hypothetical protein [Bdellovibrionales bacterium]
MKMKYLCILGSALLTLNLLAQESLQLVGGKQHLGISTALTSQISKIKKEYPVDLSGFNDGNQYVASVQDLRERKYYGVHINKFSDNYLINRVHDGIKYKLSIKGGCVSEYKAEKFINRALTIWLKALTERADDRDLVIADDVNYDIGAVEDNPDVNINLICNLENDDDVANMLPNYSGPHTIFFYPEDKDRKYFNSKIPFLAGRFSLSTLVHELGHVFGLSDTYILGDGSDEIDRSTGGDSALFGRQGPSMMNNLIYKSFKLTDDDKDGMVWLYEHFVKKNIRLQECTDGYYHESATGGCLKL